jgi:hypothetical protein
MRAVERRIEQFQLRDAKSQQPTEPESVFDETSCAEGDLFSSNGNSKNKIYGRFDQFLVYEQVDQGRLRVFFAVRDEAKRVARFDLHPGEVLAFHALAKRALFAIDEVDLMLRDELSLNVNLNVCGGGLRFELDTPLWRSKFAVTQANDLATLAVFTRRAVNQEKAVPVRFGIGALEKITLTTLQVLELEILVQYALGRAFEPASAALRSLLPPPESVTAAQIA